jgi:hypothetical protein
MLVLVFALAIVAAGCGSRRDGDAIVANSGDLGHVHDIVVEDDVVYLAAHSGLFRVEGPTRAVVVGEFRHDLMSMSSGPDGLVASGHPDLRFNQWRVEGQPAHLGFISSSDLGGTWDKVALLGEVDFHSLTSRPDGGFYGADSSGGILASADGVTWENRSRLSALDLSASPKMADSVVAIDSASGRLLVSTDGALTWDELVDAPLLRRVQWLDDSVVGIAVGGTIYSAVDPHQQWDVIGQVAAEVAAFTTRNDQWWIVTSSAAVLHSDDGENFRVIYEPPDRPGL